MRRSSSMPGGGRILAVQFLSAQLFGTNKGGGAGSTVLDDNGSCTGIGCCQASIVLGYSFYAIEIDPISALNTPLNRDISTYVYIAEQSYSVDRDINWFLENPAEVTLDWIISRSNSSTCPTNKTAPECVSTYSYSPCSLVDFSQAYSTSQ